MLGRLRFAMPLLLCLALAAWGVGVLAQSNITADGVIESTSGGFKFPDATVQTTAAAGGGGGGQVMTAGEPFLVQNGEVFAIDSSPFGPGFEARGTIVAPRGGTLKNLFVRPNSLSVTHTATTDGANFVSNIANTVAVSQGDLVTVHFQETANVVSSGANYRTSFVWE